MCQLFWTNRFFRCPSLNKVIHNLRRLFMYVINVSWFGGVPWDNNAPSMFNPNKKKSATEHLIETGGQTIDEAIEVFDKFRDYPLKITQFKPDDGKTNWVTSLKIEASGPDQADTVMEEIVSIYTKKKKELETNPSGYSIEIEVVDQ